MPGLASSLERNVLYPSVGVEVLEKAVQEVMQYRLAGLCVPPFWVKKVKRDLGSHPTRLSTVVGFPFGYQRTETKITEIETALQDGATDLEVAMNTSALFSPSSSWIKIELAKCATLAHAQQATLTVIIEGSLLEEDQIRLCCKMSADAGVDFVKNASGFVTSPLLSSNLIHQIRFFRSCLPSSIGIKAMGKTRSAEEIHKLLESGAERICIDGPVYSILHTQRTSS